MQERLGRIPNVGDYIVEQDLVITVLATEGLRVKVVGVRRGPPPEDGGDQSEDGDGAPVAQPSPADAAPVPAPPR